MSIGVINEFRNKGIAKLLLNKLTELAQRKSIVKYFSLHVVDYN